MTKHGMHLCVCVGVGDRNLLGKRRSVATIIYCAPVSVHEKFPGKQFTRLGMKNIFLEKMSDIESLNKMINMTVVYVCIEKYYIEYNFKLFVKYLPLLLIQ